MAFIRIKGIEGLMYVPEDDGGLKKHPCKDCFSCQRCSDNRCALCFKARSCTKAEPETGIFPPGRIRDR